MIIFIDRTDILQQSFPRLALGELKEKIKKEENTKKDKKDKKNSKIIIDEFRPISYAEKLGILDYSTDFLIGEDIGLIWSLLAENNYELNKNSTFFVYDGLITTLYYLLEKDKNSKKLVNDYIDLIKDLIKNNNIFSIFFYAKKDNIKHIEFIKEKFPKNKIILFEISKTREYQDEFNDFLQVLRDLGLKIPKK